MASVSWLSYFEAALPICCKTASWEYLASARPKLPSSAEYEDAVVEHMDALKRARLDEVQGNAEEGRRIIFAAEGVVNRIRGYDKGFAEMLGQAYEELKQLFLSCPNRLENPAV